MTIKLLTPWNGYPALTKLTLDSATEAGLVAAKQATTDLTGAVAYFTPPGPNSAPGPVARRRVLAGTQLVPTGKSLGGAGTAHGCFPWPHRFTHVQLVLQGLSAVSGFKAAVAASSVRGDGYTAKLADGTTNNTPTTVTFGTTDPNDSSNPGGGSATGSITAGTGTDGALDVVTGNVFSDLIALPSIERADGGSNRLLMVRGYHAAAGLPAGSFASINPANSASVDPRGTIQSIEPDWAGGYQLSFDGIANWGTYAPTGADWMFPLGVRFFSEREVFSVAHYDDSTGQGFQPAAYPVAPDEGGQFNGYVRRAIASLAALGLPFVLENHARVGQKSYAFLQNAANQIPYTRPSIAILKAWSPNDGATQSAFDTAFARLLAAVHACKHVGTVPIILVPWPIGNLNSATDSLRKEFVQRVRNLGGYQWDLDRRASDGADPARLVAAYRPASGFDNTHPSAAGHALEAFAFADFLRSVAGV